MGVVVCACGAGRCPLRGALSAARGVVRCAGLVWCGAGLAGGGVPGLLRFTSGHPTTRQPVPSREWVERGGLGLVLVGCCGFVGGFTCMGVPRGFTCVSVSRVVASTDPPGLGPAPTRLLTHPQREGAGRRGWCAGRKAQQSCTPPPQARHRHPTAPRSGQRPRRRRNGETPHGGKADNVGRSPAQRTTRRRRNGENPHGGNADNARAARRKRQPPRRDSRQRTTKPAAGDNVGGINPPSARSRRWTGGCGPQAPRSGRRGGPGVRFASVRGCGRSSRRCGRR